MALKDVEPTPPTPAPPKKPGEATYSLAGTITYRKPDDGN